MIPVVGDATDEAVADRAADLAEEAGTLRGWVNNVAVFPDDALYSALTFEDASFVNGATVPVDGGRSALAVDPEARGPVG